MYAFLNEKRFNNVMTNLYFASLSNVEEASLTLGFRYFKVPYTH